MMKGAAIFLLLTSSAIATPILSRLLRHCRSAEWLGQEPKTCLDHLCKGKPISGVYNIYPTGQSTFSIPVYCDQTTDGGGWTVFQRRMDGTVDFYRNWANYKLGFGQPLAEHWLGNDNLNILTNIHAENEMRVDMESLANENAFAQYKNFSVAPEMENYKLRIGGFIASSTAGDAMATHNNMPFSTKDRDNDAAESDCSESFKGAWWYKTCHNSNLNGLYHEGSHSSFADGINWETWKGYNEALTKTEMKFRPVV